MSRRSIGTPALFDPVLERASTVDEMETLLMQPTSAPMGAVKLVVPWRSTMQWLPADDRIVALDARLTTIEPPGTVRASAHHVHLCSDD